MKYKGLEIFEWWKIGPFWRRRISTSSTGDRYRTKTGLTRRPLIYIKTYLMLDKHTFYENIEQMLTYYGVYSIVHLQK